VRPSSLEGALDALAGDPDAKILAGGQSLIPLLSLRLARPTRLVDVSRIPGLGGIAETAQGLRIGALVRHRALLSDRSVRARAPLLALCARFIGHPAIRNRGTCGGSLAHADPTAELPAAMVALGASFRVASPAGERRIGAGDFFQGAFTTALRPDEMLIEVEVPVRLPGEGCAFDELAVREGDFAIVAVAALAHVRDGRLTNVEVVWSGADMTPVKAEELTRDLEGADHEGDSFNRPIRAALEKLTPPADIRGSSDFRRQALAVLTERTLRAAARQASAGGS
jgi:carbon-monoxide dehydrogenase medium subunit